MVSKFDKFESSWLQSVENIAKEGVQNTHHWSGRIETATENGVAKLDNVVIAAAIWYISRKYELSSYMKDIGSSSIRSQEQKKSKIPIPAM